MDADHIEHMLRWALPRIVRLTDLVDGTLSFVWNLPDSKTNHDISDTIRANLAIELEQLESFERSVLHERTKNFAAVNNLKFSKFMQSIRTVLSGMKVS